MQRQQKQRPPFSSIIKNLNCPKHNQPIVLVCIQKECKQSERTFCFQCNDESQLNKSSHILISTKKFDTLYMQFDDVAINGEVKHAKDRLAKTKQKVLKSFADIEELLGSSNDDFIPGQQEQIRKGKINNLLKNQIWGQILDMKNDKIPDEQITAVLMKKAQQKSQLALQIITTLEQSLLLELQTFSTAIKLGNLNPKSTNNFSAQRKNSNLKLSKDRKAVSNTSEYGHYFCLTQKDFDVYNFEYKFNIGQMGKETSYWFGFTFPSVSDGKKWSNIYDQGKGGFFIVIFENGNKVNFWNHEKTGFSTAEELKLPLITSYSTVELSINFDLKQLFFHLISQGKKILIKSIKPQKWFGKIYPAIGFYGNEGTVTIQ